MKIVDCFWEKRNLNCSAAEIVVDSKDSFCIDQFDFIQNYDYIVVKVPVNKIDFNLGLSKLGFVMFEMQVEMYANMTTFNFEEKNIKRLLPNLKLQEITKEEDLNILLTKIRPGMFSTDRISLDPKFGMDIGCERYKNWICDEFLKESSKTVNIIYKNNNVGFATFKETTEIRGLIGGLFSEYQNDGIGLLTTCFAPLYVKLNNLPIKKIFNPISCNNTAVWELYEYFGYTPIKPRYVFVKHNNINR